MANNFFEFLGIKILIEHEAKPIEAYFHARDLKK
jgi:hypothetical protein